MKLSSKLAFFTLPSASLASIECRARRCSASVAFASAACFVAVAFAPAFLRFMRHTTRPTQHRMTTTPAATAMMVGMLLTAGSCLGGGESGGGRGGGDGDLSTTTTSMAGAVSTVILSSADAAVASDSWLTRVVLRAVASSAVETSMSAWMLTLAAVIEMLTLPRATPATSAMRPVSPTFSCCP